MTTALNLVYHNPHFSNTANWSTVKPNHHIIGVDHGHIKVVLLPNSHRKLLVISDSVSKEFHVCAHINVN